MPTPDAPTPLRLESRFDAPFAARLAVREKQVQQSYRPMIQIHKWFARRPGTLFRNLLLSEFGDEPLADDYWQGHKISGTVIDPFMGGGTTIYEALRLGLNAVGVDVNPMSWWLVRQGIEHVDLADLQREGTRVWEALNQEVGDLYKTACTTCGDDAQVKYFFWVKTCPCPSCGDTVSLFQGYLVGEASRHPRDVLHCPTCDCLQEVESGIRVCPECSTDLAKGNVYRQTATCRSCDHQFKFAKELSAPPEHRLFGMEYQCAGCYAGIQGRQFKTPDARDHERVRRAQERLGVESVRFQIPDDAIPLGDETNRLHRWGYTRYREMFNDRQLLSLGHLQQLILEVPDERIRHALATVFSDFLRYQNLLCRYDTYALKCQDIFAVHGFPVALLACENNVPGIPGVGSGAFIHFLEKYVKAKRWAQVPTETRHEGKKKVVVDVPGENAEAEVISRQPEIGKREAWLACLPSQELDIEPGSADGAFTDPPYYDNVQYAELMDFCFVWLRTFLADDPTAEPFIRASTRSTSELTGNATENRGLDHFAEGLSAVFSKTAEALKPGAPFVFTYHHNQATAYMPLVLAILDAGLTVTAVLPAPGEMAASLHIAGTGSSILDSVFVCRSQEFVVANGLADPSEGSVEQAVDADRLAMLEADYKCTEGDLQCLRAGHMAGRTVRALAGSWDEHRARPLDERIELILAEMARESSIARGGDAA